MRQEREALRLLQGLDKERVPRAEFARDLGVELFGKDTGVWLSRVPVIDAVDDLPLAEPVPMPIARKRQPWLIVAVAATLIVALGVVATLVRTDDEPRVSTGGTVRSACEEFQRTAFTTVDRTALLGPQNASVVEQPALSRPAITQLNRAVATLIGDFENAGMTDAASLAQLSRVISLTNDAGRFVDEEAYGRAVSLLHTSETSLVGAERSLTAAGIGGCL